MRTPFSTALILALFACRPESGIDRTIITGSVSLPPVQLDELTDGPNDEYETAEHLGSVHHAVHLVFGLSEMRGESPDGELLRDIDWYTFEALISGEYSFEIDLRRASQVRVTLYEMDPAGESPTELAAEDVVGRSLVMTLETTASKTYGVRVQGIADEPDSRYGVAVIGPDPTDVLVGAYLSDDLLDRGNPVGGGSVANWSRGTAQDSDADTRFGWTGTFELRYMREFDGEAVNEDVGRVWLHAGTWSSLNDSGLPAGTLYASEAVEVTTAGAQTTVESPILLDTFVESLPGFVFAETEPNDLPLDAGGDWIVPVDPLLANDAGLLSSNGLVDTITEFISFQSANPGYIHDEDAFTFQVAEPSFIRWSVEWDTSGGDADIDAYFIDEQAYIVDYAASYDNPEVGLGASVEANTPYFLSILGYVGPGPGDVAYEVTLEATPAR